MSLFDELADAARDVTSAPTDNQMATLRDKCVALVEADKLVKSLETQLESAKATQNAIAHKDLPELFNEMGVDHFGLPDSGEFGVDLTLSPYFKASILADWPEEQKERAFNHLEEIGGGDLVKTEVKFTLGRGQVDLARSIVAMVRVLGDAMRVEGVSDIPSASISMGVPWNSLTSFVKERHAYEGSEPFVLRMMRAAESMETPPEAQMNLGILNATVGQVVKIKERKK